MKQILILLTGLLVQTAQTAVPDCVDLDVFLKAVQHHHPCFQQEGLTPRLIEEAGREMLGAEDWMFTAGSQIAYEKTVGVDPFSAKSYKTAQLSAGFEKHNLKTGGHLTLQWQYDWLRQDLTDMVRSYGVPLNNYQQGLTVTWILPLMQNSRGILDRLSYELNGFDVNIADLSRQENQETRLMQAAMRFLTWAAIEQQLAAARTDVDVYEELYDLTRRMKKAHLVEKTDVMSAENSLRLSQQSVIALAGQRNAVTASLAELAGWDSLKAEALSFDLFELRQLEEMKVMLIRLPKQSRTLKSLRIEMDKCNLTQTGLKNACLPKADLVLGAGLQKNHDQACKMLIPDKPQVSAGIQFVFPVENRTARSRLRQTQLQYQQLEMSLKAAETDLRAELKQLWIQLETQKELMILSVEQENAARQKTKAELALYQQGREPFNFVLISRLEEQSARLSLIENALQYHSLFIQMRALTDQLLVEGEA